MNTTYTLTRDGSNWTLHNGAPYANLVSATFTERKAKDAIAHANSLIGSDGEWGQSTPSEFRRYP